MIKILIIFFFFFSSSLLAQSDVLSFYVALSEKGIRVESPQKLEASQDKKLSTQKIAVIINNETLEKFYAALKNSEKVLERFSVKAQEKKVLEVDPKDMQGLEFLPVSPSYQEVPLRFSQGVYEIP